MYPTSRFFVQCPILIFLVLGLTNLVVSDLDLFTNDLYSDNTRTNNLLDNLDGSSLLGQFTNDIPTENNFLTNDILADNFIVDDIQSCRQPSKRLKVRQTDGQTCSNSEAPAESVFTPADERLLTDEEVRRYWCSDPRYIGVTIIAVCSVNPSPAPGFYYDELEGYLS